ncbi:hypothetical protein [Tabrizicola sp.]|uniref:lipase family protein n=1 Tax=Tabrizicola sp. TaxID=2005166 RepID=UPI0027349A0C|nr:hypothetical protein [Tabrizicola sp.]MDP3194621.1 hypothetical protein [Tabrizicola sp.]
MSSNRLLAAVAAIAFAIAIPVQGQTTIELRKSGSSVLAPSSVAREALPFAEISNAVYGTENAGDWKVVAGWKDLVGGGISGTYSKIVGSTFGFNAQVYQNAATGEIALAFQGTNPTSTTDWVNNATQYTGLPTPQYELALIVAQRAVERYGSDLTVTGHSLGGGLAQFVAANFNVNAVTFNAAGLSFASGADLQLGKRVININGSRDIVSSIPGSYQIGTEYTFDDTRSGTVSGIVTGHLMSTMLPLLKEAANGGKKGVAVNWAAVRLAQDNMAAVVSGNVSATGAASGSVVNGARSQTTVNGLFSRGQAVAETEWTLTAGGPENLGQGRSFGSITRSDREVIYSLNNAGQVVTAIEKQFVVGDRNARISISGLANFVTTEFPEFVGTQFNDTATIRIITQSGRTTVVPVDFLFASVNRDVFIPVDGLPEPLAGNNPNDGGGQTGFRQVTISNLNLAAGSTVTLQIEVANVGDTAYPSAILLSRVGIQ